MEQLVRVASQRPADTLRVVENLVRAPKERWFLDMHRKEIRDIVAAGYASNDARPLAQAISQHLVTLGLMEFESLAR
jgi:hypothetical protein